MFGMLKRAARAATTEVKADYAENKDFLEAVCAGVALVAAADGEIEDSERAKAMKVVSGHTALSKLYQTNDIEKVMELSFKLAKDASGRQQLARELDDIKTRPNGQQMADDVYLISLDIANADGELEDEEKKVLASLAKRLNVDPAKFEF